MQRIAVLGIGSEMNGDDAIGLLAVQKLRKLLPPSEHYLIREAGTVPEAFTGVLRRFAPKVVVLVDAAQLGLPLGELGWVPPEIIDGNGPVTHGLPLSLMVQFLQAELKCQVLILGIQIGVSDFGTRISPTLVRRSAAISKKIARLIDTLG